jgi:hypothetical protein
LPLPQRKEENDVQSNPVNLQAITETVALRIYCAEKNKNQKLFLEDKKMKTAKILMILLILTAFLVYFEQQTRAAPMGTAFTYQGHLYDNNDVADGLYDFQFKLYDADAGGGQIGSDVNIPDMDVYAGYFTVELDFGDIPDGNAVWLEIGVRPGQLEDPNSYTALSPRQQVTPAPYALYAKTAVSDNDWQISGNDMYSALSGNVGIGTSSPTQKLTIDNGDIYLKTLNGRYLFRPNPGGGSGDLAWLKYYQRSGDDTTLEIVTQNDAGDHIALMPSGNVGIGTANPDDFLEIEGSLGGNGLHLDSSSGAGIKLDRAATSNHCKLVLETDGTEQWAIGNKGENNENLGFYPYGGSTTNVVFLQNGNVGIGTATPGSKLEVNGQVKITGGSPGTNKVLTSDAGGLASWQTPSAGGDSDWTISGNDMYSAVSGRVGIGTTSPAAYLDVRPSAGSAGDEILQAFSPADASYIANDVAVVQAGPSTYTGTVLKVQSRAADDSSYGLLHIQNGLGSTPSSKFYVGGDGNVGIGTSSPTQILTVDNGDIYLKTLNGRYLFRGNPGGGSGDLAWLKYYSRSGEDTTLEIVTQNDVGDHIALMPSGNVGIGTANPSSKLEVNGQIKITGGVPGSGKVLTSDASGLASWQTPATWGDITAVYAGTGLTGGGASGDVTLSFSSSYGDGRYVNKTGDTMSGTLTVSTTGTYGVQSSTSNASGKAVNGEASDYGSSSVNYGGYFKAAGGKGSGVYGEASYDTGTYVNYGGYFKTAGPFGKGVYGGASAINGTNYGGYFEADGGAGTGVYGEATNTAEGSVNYGGYFKAASDFGTGVYGYGGYYDFYAAGPGTNYGSASSARWKNNVRPIDEPLVKVMSLRGVYFNWDAEHGGGHDVGMIAEEVGKVIPEIVDYEQNGVDAVGMDYSKLTPLLVEAIKELKEQLDQKQAKVNQLNNLIKAMDDLRAENKALEEKLTKLEAALKPRSKDDLSLQKEI